MQHAGTAATALIAAIALIKDPAERVYPLRHLRIVAEALRDMAYTYRPAERMLNVLEHVIQDFGWDIDNLPDPAPASLTQQNLFPRESIGISPQRMSRKSQTSSVDIGVGNAYASTPGLVNDSQRSDSFGSMDQYHDFDYTDVPFPAMSGANPMSWMKSMSTENSMMFPYRNDNVDSIPPDNTMMFSGRNNLMHYLEVPGLSKDISPIRGEGSLPMDAFSDYNMPKRSQRANYMDGSSVTPSTLQRDAWSLDSPGGPQISWGEVLRQMGDNVE